MKTGFKSKSTSFVSALVIYCMSCQSVFAEDHPLFFSAYPPIATAGKFHVFRRNFASPESISLQDGIISFEETNTSFSGGISHYTYQEKLELVGEEYMPTYLNYQWYGDQSPVWYSRFMVTGLIYRSPKLEVREFLGFSTLYMYYQVNFRVKNLQSQQELVFWACGPQDKVMDFELCSPPTWPPTTISPFSK